MKNYLVSYNVGVIKTTQIQLPNDYIPSSDNMDSVKKKIIKEDKPCIVNHYSAPIGCGGHVYANEGRKATKDELQIIAISNLDI